MDNRELVTLHLENGEYLTMLSDKFKNREPYITPQHALKAAIPGTVMSVIVREGQVVKRGDALCILDSMKMNNIISADDNGVVRKILIHEGDIVGKDDLMIEY